MSDPIIRRDIVQATPEWREAKAGKFSSSSAATIMGGLTTDGLERYIKRLAWERYTGKPAPDGFKSDAMQRGNDMETESVNWYQFKRECEIETVGLVDHATIPNVCWSPDGLIVGGSGRGGIEAKNPGFNAWMDTAKAKIVPSEYRWQCRWASWVGQLDYLDFIMYHPDTSGIVIPWYTTDDEYGQMAERVAVLEPRIATWIEIIGNA